MLTLFFLLLLFFHSLHIIFPPGVSWFFRSFVRSFICSFECRIFYQFSVCLFFNSRLVRSPTSQANETANENQLKEENEHQWLSERGREIGLSFECDSDEREREKEQHKTFLECTPIKTRAALALEYKFNLAKNNTINFDESTKMPANDSFQLTKNTERMKLMRLEWKKVELKRHTHTHTKKKWRKIERQIWNFIASGDTHVRHILKTMLQRNIQMAFFNRMCLLIRFNLMRTTYINRQKHQHRRCLGRVWGSFFWIFV